MIGIMALEDSDNSDDTREIMIVMGATHQRYDRCLACGLPIQRVSAIGATVQGKRAPVLQLTSLAPLVAELLGLDFDAPDGKLYAGMLDD
jgi:hypothetical protein